jgi:predicted transcriptional regulator
MLNVLQRKGRVSRALVGRAYEYRALQNRDSAQGNAIHDLLSRMFDGSVEGMVMNMVRTKQIDAKKLSEIARRVAEVEGAPNADRK